MFRLCSKTSSSKPHLWDALCFVVWMPLVVFGEPSVARAAAVANVTVEADVPGAQVMVNGKSIGTVPLTLSLQPGRYLVEVSKEGYETWRKWLDAAAAQSSTLKATMRSRSGQDSTTGTGTIVVASDVFEATVLVDGNAVGSVPALIDGLTPGRHSVEVQASGYASRTVAVQVLAGKTAKVRVRLTAASTQPAATARLHIDAEPDGAEVWIDGVFRGKAPLSLDNLSGGIHRIELRKEGLQSATQTTRLDNGKSKTLRFALKPEPSIRKGALEVRANVAGADVFVDGRHLGKVPLAPQPLVAGPHLVSVRSKGHQEFIQTVEVRPGTTTRLNATLRESEADAAVVADEGAPEQPAEASQGDDVSMMTSYSAHLIMPRFIAADVSLGFPHLVEARLTTGIADFGEMGLDGGVDLRTYGAMTEVALRARLRVFERRPWAVAAGLDIGGGGGPKSRNTLFVNLSAVGSVLIKRAVDVSARAVFSVYSDRHCPETQSNNELPVCSAPPAGITQEEARRRFAGVRLMFAAMVEVPILPWLNIFGLFEFAPFQGNREAYSDPFASVMPESDPGIYGRVGVTFKR